MRRKRPRREDAAAGAVPGFAVVLAAISAVTYGSFLLEHFLSTDLDPINGYASELSAVDQPFNAVYSGGDGVAGALSIIVAITALMTLRRRPWATAGWIFFGAFGVSAIGDATFPLECAPSLETWCALRERAGQVSFAHQFHAVTSTTTITMAILATICLAMAARRYGRWPALARWGLPLAAAETLSSVVTVALMVAGRWLGIAQRIQISLMVAALLLVAWSLHAQRRAARTAASRDASERATTSCS